MVVVLGAISIAVRGTLEGMAKSYEVRQCRGNVKVELGVGGGWRAGGDHLEVIWKSCGDELSLLFAQTFFCLVACRLGACRAF